MGDRSQIYIKYDKDKLLAIQEKYFLGYDFIDSAVFYAKNVISFLKGKEELINNGEDLLDRFFFLRYFHARYEDRQCNNSFALLIPHSLCIVQSIIIVHF